MAAALSLGLGGCGVGDIAAGFMIEKSEQDKYAFEGKIGTDNVEYSNNFLKSGATLTVTPESGKTITYRLVDTGIMDYFCVKDGGCYSRYGDASDDKIFKAGEEKFTNCLKQILRAKADRENALSEPQRQMDLETIKNQ